MGLKFRRGSTAQQSGSLAFGEPYVNTTLGTLVVGGATGDIVLSAGGTGSTGNFGAISGSGLDITGNANIAGNLTLGGTITIGDNISDTVNVVASLSSSLLPSVTNAFDLGSTSKVWRDLYISTGSIKVVNNGSVVSTLSTNADGSQTFPNGLYSQANIQIGDGSYTNVGKFQVGRRGNTPDNNSVLGIDVMPGLTSGNYNTGIGRGTLYSLTTGVSNIALGNQAGYALTDGTSNIAIGSGAAFSLAKTTTIPTVSVGTEYQGGKVAYILQSGDPGYDSELTKGFIVSPLLSTSSVWGCSSNTTGLPPLAGADATAIGTGYQNTLDILAGCGEAGIAARLAADYGGNGYDDWFLPSQDELLKVMDNQVALGIQYGYQYWSSTDSTYDPNTPSAGYTNLYAIGVDFNNTELRGARPIPKHSPLMRVFAIRNFSIALIATSAAPTSNTLIGDNAASYAKTGNYNTALGGVSLLGNADTIASNLFNNNTALGYAAGNKLVGASSNNIYLGANAGPNFYTSENYKFYVGNGDYGQQAFMYGNMENDSRTLTINAATTISGSITATSFAGQILANNGVISSSTQLTTTFDTRYLNTNADGVVSGSSQITYASISSIPAGIVSGSSQITYASISSIPAGIVSGSSQITYASISSIPAGIVSGSSQITYASISSIPAGIVSGSSQVTLSSTTGGGTSDNVRFGSLGIGMAASGTSGRIDAANDVVAFSTSDIRLKENIKPIENALDKISKISGNTYDWKSELKDVHGYDGNDVGVIAQEIEAVLPQLVQDRDNGYKAVKYDKLVALLIEGIKEQQTQIHYLTIEIEKLKESKGL